MGAKLEPQNANFHDLTPGGCKKAKLFDLRESLNDIIDFQVPELRHPFWGRGNFRRSGTLGMVFVAHHPAYFFAIGD